MKVERILCPVDFSAPSRHAMERAVDAGRRWNAQITIVHVHTTLVPWGPFPGVHGNVPVLPAPSPEELAEEVRRFYSLSDKEVSADIVLRTGSPAREIVDVAEESAADLVVMGTHGRGSLDRIMLGSVTERVLRTTRTPVLTVPPHDATAGTSPMRYATVLCGIDFSHASMRAMQYAFAFAMDETAKVILLHVVEGTSDLPRETAHFHVPEYETFLVQDTTARLAAAVPPQVRQYAVENQVSVGKAHREIVRVATDTNADLIVMGVHGEGVKERWFGSTTGHVIRGADCPVLTVRADSHAVAIDDLTPGEGRPS